MAQLEEIAKTKMEDLNAASLDAASENNCRQCAQHGPERGGFVMAKLSKKAEAH